MVRYALIILLFGVIVKSLAQTNTTTSGNWTDPTIWSTGVVPTAGTTTNVNHPVTINQNIGALTAYYTVNSNAVDPPGGAAQTLSVGSGGTLDVYGYMVFEGAGSTNGNPAGATIIVRNGGTLILGPTSIGNRTTVIVEAGGTLIINGNMTINDPIGSFTVGGILQVNGNLDLTNGNVDVDGSGDVFTTGTISTTGGPGGATIFGSSGDCGAGPCSGRNLCGFTNTISANQTLCTGSTPAALSGNAVLGGPTYRWESSTTSSSTGFANASGTNNTQNYTPGLLTQTTWFRRVVIQGGCTGISPPVQITVLPSGGWRGTTSNWNTATNWCSNAVPTATTDVTITTGVPNQPVISAAAVCRDLTITSGASVTINAANTLDIKGNFVNNGTFTINTSTVTLTGTSSQTISGNSLINFNNLTINNTSGSVPAITFNGIFNINVNSNLTLTNGVVNLNGYNLTLGTAAGSPGALARTNGWLYGGNLTRWFGTAIKALGSSGGTFPVGTATDYRPFFVGHASALTTGGTVRVRHTGITGSTDVNFLDNAIQVQKRSNSFWSIATGNGLAGGGAVSLRAEGTGFGIIQEVTDLRLTQIGSAPGTPSVNAGTPANPQVNRGGLTAANISNFSYYISSIDGINSPLPITLLYLDSELIDDNVELTWATSEEEDFSHFIIQHSVNGSVYKDLAYVPGAGYNTESINQYSYTHELPVIGTNYYRLKAVDLDGTFEYLGPVSERFSGEEALWIHPNPSAGDKVVYQTNFTPNENDRVLVYNQLGSVVADEPVIKNNGTVYFTESLKAGAYILKYSTGQQVLFARFIVVK
jgi:hypothetical protein